MKTMVLTAGVWPTYREAKEKLWIFLASCKKYGIEPSIYGIGTAQFPGYKKMMLDMQLEYLKTVKGKTHCLFSDGWDAMFTGPLDEIECKYIGMGSPSMLISAFFQLGNVSDEEKQYPGCFEHKVKYCYPNRGGYIAEIPYIIDMFERMLKLPRQTGDDCFNYYDAWQEGWFRPVLDSECSIFQVSDSDCGIQNGYLYNRYTETFPCVLHLSGGFTSPDTGKDHVMKPWAEKLGII